MRQKGIGLTIAFLTLAAATLGAADHYRVLGGPDRFYYGHISYTEAKGDAEDPVVLREGQAGAETAVLNLPLGPGDTVRTSPSRRCEIQFDTGTVVRLDFSTELKIEIVLAQSLSAPSQVSNLSLARGRVYIMYKQYDSREMFQVLTRLAAVKLGHNSVAVIRAAADGSTDAQVKAGKASVMFGPDEKTLQKQALKSGERLTLVSATQFARAAYLGGSEFELWNDEVNARFDELHKGQSALPKPIQKLPPAVFYFAQRYGNLYGEWAWDDLYGYVWRPFLDRMDYPWGWAPYFYGRWTSVDGQLYWVPEEPWGWIPYHLGIWQWDKKLGWVWLPGSLFAPAWVDWEFFFGSFGWRPCSLFDWFDGFSTDFLYWGDSWNYIIPGGPGRIPVPGSGPRPGLTTISRNQLKQPPSTTMPRELKTAYKNVLMAYRKGDTRVLDSMKKVTSETVFVSRADLNASRIQEKALSFEKLPKPSAPAPAKGATGAARTSADTARSAAQVFRVNQAVREYVRGPATPGPAPRFAAAPEGPGALRVSSSTAPAAAGASRPAVGPGAAAERAARLAGGSSRPQFLDWNPDVKVARSLGVRIEYSSRANQVRCPELGLSSLDRTQSTNGFVPRLTSSGVRSEPASTAISGGSSGSASGAAGSPGVHAAATTTAAPAKGSSSGGGGGGKIKN
ncbi:MAG TPA: DUF6600 domain-containing protein [Terriglobales bacterium]|nr:DUF6600 domain-containing protein [Terriglobales bacterium]